MKKIASVLLLAASVVTAQAQSPTLRSTVLIASDIVRIGDLVADVSPDKADIAVFRSPDLGETGSVPVRTVLAALRPHGVAVDAQGVSDVSVTRASRMIGASELKQRIAEITAQRLRVADIERIAVTFDGPVPTLHLDPSEAGPLMPRHMTFDPRSGRFEMVVRSGGAQVHISGLAQETQEAVVLMRPVARGQVLRAGDVAIEKRPKAELQADAIGDLSAAIGMALQQQLRPGQVIRSTDLMRPQLVKRGEPVMIIYEVPGITLSARGKSEDAGVLGDTINVTNIQSKRIIQAIVTGPAQVTVTSLSPRVTLASENRMARHAAANRNAVTKAE
jgi:flagella basal body P-ring formation protein FlgA